jgi:hypothetical protein
VSLYLVPDTVSLLTSTLYPHRLDARRRLTEDLKTDNELRPSESVVHNFSQLEDGITVSPLAPSASQDSSSSPKGRLASNGTMLNPMKSQVSTSHKRALGSPIEADAGALCSQETSVVSTTRGGTPQSLELETSREPDRESGASMRLSDRVTLRAGANSAPSASVITK